jgi:hypothetical protein
MIPFRHRLKLRVINTAMLNPIMKNINWFIFEINEIEID